MANETILDFPKGVKATIYATGAYGQVFKEEAVFLSFVIQEKSAQYHQVPMVRFRKPRKRRVSYFERSDAISRFILVVEGWGLPDAPRSPCRTTCDVHDRVRYQPHLARSREDILSHARAVHRKVLVDVHEAITAPRWMTEPERTRTRRSIVNHLDQYRSGDISADDLRAVVASEVFTEEGHLEIMRDDPCFVEDFGDWLGYEVRRADSNHPAVATMSD
jgi:hypothetical protein